VAAFSNPWANRAKRSSFRNSFFGIRLDYNAFRVPRLRTDIRAGFFNCLGGSTFWDALQLFEISLLDLPHHITATHQVQSQLGTDLGRHDKKLVVCHLAERNRPSRGHQVRAPLINEAEIP
jgi:hypothetical protein